MLTFTVSPIHTKLFMASTINAAGTLVDGKAYDLGIGIAEYVLAYDAFIMRGRFIDRRDTIYSAGVWS
jgi:hypothetical protein